MSVVLRPFQRAENFAKVRQVFELAKYFADFFYFFDSRPVVRLTSVSARSQKRVQR